MNDRWSNGGKFTSNEKICNENRGGDSSLSSWMFAFCVGIFFILCYFSLYIKKKKILQFSFLHFTEPWWGCLVYLCQGPNDGYGILLDWNFWSVDISLRKKNRDGSMMIPEGSKRIKRVVHKQIRLDWTGFLLRYLAKWTNFCVNIVWIRMLLWLRKFGRTMDVHKVTFACAVGTALLASIIGPFQL